MLKSILVAAGVIIFLQSASPGADSLSHRQAAERFFEVIGAPQMIDRGSKKVADTLIARSAELRPYREEIDQFVAKYVSWEAIKTAVLEVYTTEFTESELNELTQFYKTETGKKALLKLPGLLDKCDALGKKQVADHLPELLAAIRSAKK
jgi:hypothetical protein